MKIENLTEGLVVKNYKELCRLLEIEEKRGKGRDLQVKDFERYFTYERNGHNYIIKEIYDEPLEKVRKRGFGISIGKDNGKWKEYDNFKIPYELRNNRGVYKITLGNEVYIGSTSVGFRKRFQQHYNGTDVLMQHTHDMLHNGGNFEILFDMTEIEDRDLIKMVEDIIIKKYLVDNKWEVINKKSGAKSYDNVYKKQVKKKKKRKRIIRIDEDKLYDAISLLAQHGLIDEEGAGV